MGDPKRDPEKNNDSKDHIDQHENTDVSCRGINLKTRLRAINGDVLPTLFYEAETLTITKASLLSRLDAFEMWICRRVLKISWTGKITNKDVLRRIRTGRYIVRQFKTRRLQYLGHLIIYGITYHNYNYTRRKDRMQKFPSPTREYTSVSDRKAQI